MGDEETTDPPHGKKIPPQQKHDTQLPPPPPPPEQEQGSVPPEPTVQPPPQVPTPPPQPTPQPRRMAYPPPPAPQVQPYHYPPYQQIPQYPQQPSPYYPPPPAPPMQYAPPQAYPSPVYSWQLLPYSRRELLGDDGGKKSIFVIIGALLIITAALQFPIAGLLAYYSTSEGVEFGGTFDLRGTIKAKDGTNLSGVRVSIVGTSLFAISDDNGEYIINGTPNGIWRIEAQLTGYRVETRRVIVHEILFNEVNFELKDGGGSEEVNDLWFFISLAILTLMFSIFVLAGAMYSFKGKRFTFVFVGAILGIFTMSPALAFWFLPLVFILGIIGFFTSMCALILIIWHRQDFKEWSPPHDEIEATH